MHPSTLGSPHPHPHPNPTQATRDSSKGHLQTSTLTLTVATSWKGVGRFFMALVIFATAYDLFCTVSAVRLTYLQGRTLVSYLFPRCERLAWAQRDAIILYDQRSPTLT